MGAPTRLDVYIESLVGTNDGRPLISTEGYFLGPIQMRREDGRAVRLAKPQLNKPETYPPKLERAQWERELASWRRGPPAIRNVELRTNHPVSFPILDLRDYFQFDRPGRYEITFSPKLYLSDWPLERNADRSLKTPPSYYRIDFAPITLTTTITVKSLQKDFGP
jgi:hypothetical protein